MSNKIKKAIFFVFFFCLLLAVFNGLLFFYYQKKHSLTILSAAYAMFSQTGTIDTQQHLITTRDAVDGFLAYGPYAKVEKGRYRAFYTLSLENVGNSDDIERAVGFCDVNVMENIRYNSSLEMKVGDFRKPNSAHFVLPLEIADPGVTVEFRVFQYAGNRFILRSIMLVPYWHTIWQRELGRIKYLNIIFLFSVVIIGAGLCLGKRKNGLQVNYRKVIAPLFLLTLLEMGWWWFSSATNMLSRRFLIPSQISEFKEHKISNEGKEGFLVYGPYITLAPGKYRVQFLLRREDALRATEEGKVIGFADVFSSQFPEIRSYREIRSSDFKRKNPARIFLNFTVPAGFPELEFRIFTFKNCTLTLEKYTLRSRFPSALFYIGNALALFLVFILYPERWLKRFPETILPSQKMKFVVGGIIGGILLAGIYQFVVRKIGGYPYPYGTILYDAAKRFGDFGQTHEYVKDFLYGKNPYLASSPSSYFPFMFVALAPLGLLQVKSGIFLYGTVVAGFFLVLFFKYLRTSAGVSTNVSFLIAGLFMITSYPFLFMLARGNIEGILFIFLALFTYAYLKKKYLLSCVPLAMAIGMKVYPAVFLVLYLSDRKYKEFFAALFLTVITICTPLFLMPGSLSGSISGLLQGMQGFNTFFTNDRHGGWDILFNHSLFNAVKGLNALYWFITDYDFFARFYSYMALGIFMVVSSYVVFRERIFWRKVTLLTVTMVLLPHISFDYTLINLYLPLLFFLVAKGESRVMTIRFSFLFTLSLIPKNYFMIDGKISLATFMNPLIMASMILFIIYEGMSKNRIPEPETK